MKILDRLPISEKRTSIRFGDRHVTVYPNQILVWLSVHLAEVLEPEANMPRFPALLDTGNNFGFSVPNRHLRDWAGIDPDLMDSRGDMKINRQSVTCREAAVWLHPNTPGRREASIAGRPFRLTMAEGIGVYPPDADPPGPRLPLLGLPALLDSDLDCWIDPEPRQVTVQTRSWRRRLIRLIGRS